ncbi:MAG: OmpH family outer membrane protein [Bacteroidota bacterium]
MNRFFGPLLVLSLLLSSGALYLAQTAGPKTAYVDLARVYDAFQYKQQLEQQLHRSDQAAQFLLDSLEVQLQGVAQLVSDRDPGQLRERYQVLQRNYALTQRELMDQQSARAQELDEKIWVQLNQYLEDFARGENYDYLIGARGDGTIIGGKPAYDVTNDIIHYVNQRYHGKMD